MPYLLELHDRIQDAKQRVVEARKEIDAKTAELEELQDKAWYCHNCEKYYPKESTTQEQKKKTQVETIIRDCGYGDDDVLADVTRLFTYDICPVCGKSYQRDYEGVYLGYTNRRTRR